MNKPIRLLSWTSVLCLTATLSCLPLGTSSPSSKEYYELYTILEQALIIGQNNSSSNLRVIADAFFPKRSSEPICVSIMYTLLCNNSLDLLDADEYPMQCVTEHNPSFLWTEYDVTESIGTLLFSYSHNGIALKGFEWEKSCLVENKTEIVLQVSSTHNYSRSLLDKCLGDLTSQLKAYADAQGIPDVSSKYKGYAINWNNSERDISPHDTIFTAQVIVLSIFIFFFSLSSSNFLYQNLFNSIYDSEHHHSVNPGYPLFWGIVVLSVIWNVVPSWLVISSSRKVIYSLVAVIPLLLLVAIGVKKNTRFPIPGFKLMGCLLHTRNKHSFVCHKCVSCTLRHFVQVCAIWSLLVTFAFFVHYFTAIVLAFYLDPLGSLVKILYVKTIALSLIFTFALLFTLDKPDYKCTLSAMKKNLTWLIATVTIISILPLLAYLVFVVGEIIFNDYSQSGSWKSIFTVIPPAMILFVSWYSHGLLFPKGVTDPTKPIKDIEQGLEGNGTHHDDSLPHQAGGGDSTDPEVPMDGTPLLPHGGQQSLNRISGGSVSHRNYNSVSSSLSESGGKLPVDA